MSVLKIKIITVILIFTTCFSYGQVARELEVGHSVKNTIENKEELLAGYYELTNEVGLASRGRNTVYKENNLSAIQFPVGGIGTGCIQYDGHAVPRYWQIFNNMTHDFVPNSFFAIRTKEKEKITVRALQTKDVNSFKGMKSLEAVSEFPFLKYTFKDALPVKVSMEVYNPFVPMNLKESGIPAVFYEFTVENITKNKVRVNLLSSQQNAVGFSKIQKINRNKSFADNFKASIARKPIKGNEASFYGGNSNSIRTEKGAKVLFMEDNEILNQEHFGQMAMLVLGKGKIIKKTKGIASWTNEKELYKQFENKGEILGEGQTKKSEEGSTWTGALNIPITLNPGEKKVIKMALVWSFPNGKNGGHMDKWDAWGKGDWEGNGNNYANHWKNIQELTSYVINNHEALRDRTKTFTNTLYNTNLPHWLMERVGNQLAILKSRTLFHDKNGFVGLWEGAGSGDGSCSGNCNHVWHYAQSHARLFPKLGKSIKEQSFKAIKENGQIPYRLPNGTPAFDGQCGDILGAYREYLLSSDSAWLKSQYPAIKKAMNYLINKHDADKDGWLSEARKHTTYDASMTGNPSFLSSLYLAALRASEKMAIASDDSRQSKEWKKIADSSSKLQSDKLWNGEYFYQIPGEKKATDYENACHSDQLLGQWWADQLDLGDLYPAYKLKLATEAILKYNFKSNLKKHNQGHRTFALPEEAGMVVSTWPNNDRTPYASGYSSEVWTTFEYTIGAALLKHGKIQDALTILRSGYKRYDGKLRTGYTGDWGNFGFSGNPFGDDECGQFYGRALSVWSVLLAAQGFKYNGPDASIGFDPKWQPENHKSFFSTAKGWGEFGQERNEIGQNNYIQLNYGRLKLKKIQIRTEFIDAEVKVLFKNKRLPIKSSIDSHGNMTLSFEAVDLIAGDKIEIIVTKS